MCDGGTERRGRLGWLSVELGWWRMRRAHGAPVDEGLAVLILAVRRRGSRGGLSRLRLGRLVRVLLRRYSRSRDGRCLGDVTVSRVLPLNVTWGWLVVAVLSLHEVRRIVLSLARASHLLRRSLRRGERVASLRLSFGTGRSRSRSVGRRRRRMLRVHRSAAGGSGIVERV